MANDITRRAAICAIAGGAGLAWWPGAAVALTEARARSLVQSLVNEINAVIASGKSEQAMYRDFERIFARYADVPTVALYTLGVDGRSATAAQKRAYIDAFRGYIARKYGSRFREFIGGRLEVESVQQIKNYYQVRTIAYLRGEDPFFVDFHVSDRSGEDRFFNMFIEGVNMLLTEREEIGAMLDRRGRDLDRLIADLRTMG
ncbi:ABC transporter substrate-binding protein [Rhodosalinus halophilus]|uniref:ABC transporter substrate-binding protein n=1 Tax=Rhodosalinus halophilus TaxID=2259333 RepID=A0A365U985_9RHOB|nr:ABC transporter substrate-binding protein [Rhodosalinus halophilus]RBI85570.1 ABC transporter substrate-binding protein [Rhodosalinus halophilus]